MYDVYIGGDPECFILDKKTKKPVPAHLYFLTQDEAIEKKEKVPSWVDRYQPFRDGFAVEFNFAPDLCRERMIRNFRSQVRIALGAIPPSLGLYPISAVPVVSDRDWPKDMLVSGCRPSLSAYRDPVVAPKDLSKLPFRAAGGHFHISWKVDSYRGEKAPDLDILVKMFDVFAGIPFTYIFRNRPEIFKRREIYGRAGDYRSKNERHVEYRVLGPEAWGKFPLISFFSGLLRQTIDNYPKLLQKWTTDWDDEVQTAINTGKNIEKLAKKLTVNGWLSTTTLDALAAYAKNRSAIQHSPSHQYGFSRWASRVRGRKPAVMTQFLDVQF